MSEPEDDPVLQDALGCVEANSIRRLCVPSGARRPGGAEPEF
jgi:hypothetical protein